MVEEEAVARKKEKEVNDDSSVSEQNLKEASTARSRESGVLLPGRDEASMRGCPLIECCWNESFPQVCCVFFFICSPSTTAAVVLIFSKKQCYKN